jgi:DNA-binding IclR family transcriptional regulator
MQDEGSHRYYLGPLVTRLASNPRTTHEYLITCAIGEMTRLWDIVEETVTLCVMVALQHVILHEIPSKHDLRVTEENRRLGSLYAGATVKVLLSQFNEEQMEAVMKHINITHITGNTVTDKAVLAAHVKKARQRGYAITYGEKIPGAMGMAVPVLHYPYPAALSFIGPETRISPRINDFLKELKASGRKISDNVADVLKN